ncbi:MAG: ribbon-helix-helix domain-containing protein, partial [Dolichospermum sp.]
MSKRFSVTVPDTIFEELEKMADTQGRTTANLAAFLIETGIREIKKTQPQNPK